MSKKPLLAAVILAILAILLVIPADDTYTDEGDDDPQYRVPEKAEPRYPDLGTSLNRMVASVEAGQAVEKVTDNGAVHNAGMVAVSIYLSGDTDGVVSFLEDNGGSPRNVGEAYIEAYVPVPLLGQVSEQPGVLRVREIIPPQQTGPAATGDGDDIEITLPEKTELKYPNLGSRLDQLVAIVEKGETSAKEAAEDAPVHQEASVAVTIYLSGNVDDVVKFLEDNGGSPRNVGEDYIEAYVPVSLLGQVSERPGVIRAREIASPQAAQIAQQVAGHGPPVHGSSAWNQAGFSGQGIKVGVFDSNFGFNDFMGLMGTELPSTVQARCYTDVGRFTSNLADCGNAILGDNHGTLVAEAVMDIAPEASLYIAAPWSVGDLRTATDWMVSEGVSVIVHSVIYNFDGPGDGTSPFSDSPLKTVDRAVAGGIVWVAGAGNYYHGTWFGTYSIVNVDGTKYVAFNGSDVFNDIALEVGDVITVQLRWEDSWSGTNRDFDLLIWDFATSSIVDYSFDPQQGRVGQVPFELLLSYQVPRDGRYAVAVLHEGGSTPGWIQLIVWGVGSIEHYTGTGSIGNPAESSNPGMLAVGAARWNNVRTIEPYSSRGPTPDRRVKPDIVGADCGATALRNGFCGTSQAAPHVAGMAALVRQRFPTYTPVQVANYLKEHAEQRESPDPNNTWGHGFAQLPPLSECSDAVPSAASNPGLVADCEALLAARDTLAGSGTLNWSGSTAIAAWDGVTVGGSPLRVTKLFLRGRQLTGTIPPELGGLASLVELNLGENRLTGLIPSELSSLTNLEILSLIRNQLTGPIPAGLSELSNLEILALGGNQLTGPIPTWLGNIINLEQLYLGGNQLTGPIPASLGSLSDLSELSLSQNQLTGPIPAELGSLANLQELSLWGNQLTGTIPAVLSTLTNLETLDLSGNQLTGPIPAELGNLSNLQLLSLWGNQLTGTIPPELARLTNLNQLDLSHNQLTGPVPAWLGGLANLGQLDLSQNQLSGPIPTELGSLSKLQKLSLWGNQLSGAIPAELGSLSKLQKLSLWGNQLSGAIPAELGSLSDLSELSLSQNQLTGPIPAELGSLANLQELSLWGNQLTGTIPAVLSTLTNLEALDLSHNQLTGTIPAVLSTLTNLETLDLSGNLLTGPIPAELGNLSNLQLLSLWGNQLTGPIPAELGNLSNLQLLSLWGNQLTGTIPPELARLTNLNQLDLSHNQLTGPVPAWLGGLANLGQLDLAHNQLSGAIPTELGSLSKLQKLSLWGNQLSGAIPAELGSLSKLQKLSLWGNQLSGAIPAELGSLSDLSELSLSQNQLTGPIPAELGSLANLQELSLWGNQLTGTIPAVLSTLTNLEALDLSHNQLTGTIPAVLSTLTNLETLDLSGNLLTGPIPAELGNLSNLQLLSLWGNQLTGPIPAELGNLSNLQLLSLWGNQLTGTIPPELARLTNLNQLDLSHNQLTGPVPAWLGGLANLEQLSLAHNQLSGAIPTELGSLSKLQKLSLWGNQLSGAIPASLGSLSDLSELSLSQNQLTGPIPAELGSLANLQELSLWGNQLTGPIPASLGSLTNLKQLELNQNQLAGPIPSALSSLTNLEILFLGENQLAGPIPTWLGSLANLQVLSLWGNQLTGPIPSALSTLTNLEILVLSQNQLAGPIPTWLGSLANLQVLSLWGNQLTGPIPASLGSLANLQVLFLSQNQLAGPIPSELGSLTKLEDLFLSGNQLTGCIPVGIAGVANNDLSQLGLPFCAGALGAPTIGTLTPGADFLTITWAAPTGSPESAIIAYDLRYIESAARDKSDVNWTVVDNAWTTGSGALSYQISGLTSGTRYDVQVRAVTAAGDGPWSATAAVTPATWGAVRSLSSPSVSPGGQVVVTITANGFGAFGGVVETLPPGFSYVSSSLEDSGVTDVGREVRFSLLGQTAFTYTVTASSAAGTYSFSGVLRNSDREDVPVGGALTIAVAAGDPLIVRYDANNNGMIEKIEVINAINDYLFGEGDAAISKSDVIKLINLYLFG